MEPFKHQHTFQFDEKLYVSLHTLFLRKNKPFRMVLSVVAGCFFLFWEYSFLAGLLILLLVTTSQVMPLFIPHTAANTFNKSTYLHSPLTYGVNEKKLWVRGQKLDAEFDWELASVWDTREGWLRISADQFPSLWFKVSALKDSGVYEQVIQLCYKHALQFNS